ncbi:MAG: uroporphyrinogen decarboxylase [Deltaproteobacteria bacterium]|nr:uroporphyrinogen decarboxylase [Deltaproteobacteria bacterium]
MNGRERFLASCAGEAVDRPAVWLMRQAGRYLPEYRDIRASHGFWEMMTTPELAALVTLQPVRRFGMDAAILFSDILTVAAAMGADVRYEPGGPVVSPLVRDAEGISRLKAPDRDAFGFVSQAVRSVRASLGDETALIGFAGAPFTLAAYMACGGPSKSTFALKAMAHREPDVYRSLMNRVSDAAAELLSAQIEAGADAVQLFDTWSGQLGPDDYASLALPYTRRVIERLGVIDVPVIVYVRNAAGNLEQAASSGATIVAVDGSIRLTDARARLRKDLGLQGNFDPALLAASPSRIRADVRAAVDALRGTPYVVNVGEGLTPETPLEGVAAFVDAVKETSR